MPTIVFEEGSRAVPVDFRRCRSTGCGDGSGRGAWSTAPTQRLPVTAFVHVVDCRAGEAERLRGRRRRLLGPARRQPLHPVLDLLRGLGDPARRPDRRRRGLPPRRLGGGPDPHRPGRRGRRASLLPRRLQLLAAASPTGARTPGSTRSRTPPKTLGARAANGWGPETDLLLVSGGSHAGNAVGIPHVDRFTPGRRVHLIPLEPIAADRHLDLRDHPALAQEGLARPGGRGTD